MSAGRVMARKSSKREYFRDEGENGNKHRLIWRCSNETCRQGFGGSELCVQPLSLRNPARRGRVKVKCAARAGHLLPLQVSSVSGVQVAGGGVSLCPPEVFAFLRSPRAASQLHGWGTLRREYCGGGMASLLLGVVEEVRYTETVKYIRSSRCRRGHVWQHTEYSLARSELLSLWRYLQRHRFSGPFLSVFAKS